MKNTRLTTTPSPSPSTVYTFKTSPCMPAPRAHVENTCTRGAGTHGVFQRVTTHTNTHTHTTPQPTTTARPPHHTETDTERDRDRREKDRERRQRKKTDNERRGDEREEDKTTEERREKIHFQCGGAWPFFIDGVLFLVNPACARDFSLLNRVKYDCSLISFSVSWQVNSF